MEGCPLPFRVLCYVAKRYGHVSLYCVTILVAVREE